MREIDTAVAKRKDSQPALVDRAIVAVENAVGRVAALLGDDDPAVMELAALTLSEIGPFVVGPLAEALPRTATFRDWVVIIVAIANFERQVRVSDYGCAD